MSAIATGVPAGTTTCLDRDGGAARSAHRAANHGAFRVAAEHAPKAGTHGRPYTDRLDLPRGYAAPAKLMVQSGHLRAHWIHAAVDHERVDAEGEPASAWLLDVAGRSSVIVISTVEPAGMTTRPPASRTSVATRAVPL